MSEAELRQRYVATAEKYLGYNEADGSHKVILDIYNTMIKPLPRGYKMQPGDEWCAAFVSAMAAEAGLLDIIFAECSCNSMISLFKKAGRWVESDAYKPSPGDLIMYDWEDTTGSSSDNTGRANHVGIVVSCDGSSLKIIEGNKSDPGSVAYRTVKVNGKYIRGFCTPNFASKVTTTISANRYLTEAEMQTNARFIWDYLGSRGWTRNAVAGMLGNMETESTINPGIWQDLDEGDTSSGYGLVQWTPATKYLDWCAAEGLEPSSMTAALKRLEWELENGEQFYKTGSYPITFKEFKVSTASADYLGRAFLYNYERPKSPNPDKRGAQAEKWYNYLLQFEPGSGGSEDEPDRPEWHPNLNRRIKTPLWLLMAAAKRNGA